MNDGLCYHVFCFLIDGIWYRTRQVFNDRAFDSRMDKLQWKVPYNVKVFHFMSKEFVPVTTNRVFLARPVIDVDLEELFEERHGVRLQRPNKQTVPVLRFGGSLVIVETADGYNRLLPADGELLFNELFPLPFATARAFVDKHHRYNEGPSRHKFSIGLLQAGKLVGVIIASTPKARVLDDGFTLELNRCCVLPDQRNACSKLYGKAILAGRCMGYRKFVTYTLTTESGSSVKAVGFKLDGLTQARPKGWHSPSRARKIPKRYPTEPKCRWILTL
jgi:hypothetical protein